MKRVTITIRNQSIILTSKDFNYLLDLFYNFNKFLVIKSKVFNAETKRYENKVVKTGYVVDLKKESLIYHRVYENRILKYLEERNINYDLIYDTEYEIREVKYDINPNFKPRDYQEEFKNYVLERYDKKPVSLIDLKTGYGKTFTVAYIMSKLNVFTGFILMPKYIDKTVEDLEKYLNIKKDEIFIVSGRQKLNAISIMSDEELSKYKVIIFSLRTIQIYIKNYLDIDEPFYYEIEPEYLIRKLKLGLLIGDEVHQDFMNIFYSLLFLDVKHFIALTATPTSSNYFIKKFILDLFPVADRLKLDFKDSKYINVIGVRFFLNNIRKIRFKSSLGYNHVKFEQSLLKNEKMLKNYFEMLYKIIKSGYVDKRKNEDKGLVFMSTVALCKEFTDYLRKKDEFKGLRINKYTEEDDFSIIDESDLIISTMMSSGTGLDIKNLIFVLQTISVESVVANKQTLGRLRNLNHLQKDVYFYFIYSPMIDSHNRHIKNRLTYFKDFMKSLRMYNYNKNI